MKGSWCKGTTKKESVTLPQNQRIYPWSAEHPEPNQFRKVRTRCPVCDRLLTMTQEYYHDGDAIILIVPKHKVRAFQTSFKTRRK